MNQNCHNSNTSNYVDLKLEPVIKFDKRNAQKIGDEKSVHCDVTVIFPVYGQFGAIWKSDSGRMIYSSHTFLNSNFLS